MKRLFYIVVMMVVVCCTLGCSKKTTECIYLHDTLTVERQVVQFVHQHDTVTIHDNSERLEERIVYDTLERVKEVVKVQWRNKIVTEQGSAQVQVVHDTVTVQAGAVSKTENTTRGASPLWQWLTYATLAAMMCAGALAIIKRKD